MASFGYFLSSEELGPKEEVRWARRAEEAGFERIWISDHCHPWNDEQGESALVWALIGGIAATTRLHVTTAVTCPTVRVHPAVIAQAAATASLLLDGTRPRGRHRRAPERAHPRRSLAADRCPPQMTAGSVPCGPDPERHVATITPYLEAGCDEVYISQMGPDQEGLLRFWEQELKPRLPI